MTKTRRLFGTDGIRGKANTDPMTAGTALRLGQALGCSNLGHLLKHGEGVTRDVARARVLFRDACAAGLPADRPNMVMGADVHTCWEKFARYFEVEARVVPLQEGRYTIGAAEVEPLLDERTIAVATASFAELP